MCKRCQWVHKHVIKCECQCFSVLTYLERNCTAIQTPAYMRPLISQESMSKSAMNPMSHMTTNGVPSITFCLNSWGRVWGDRWRKSGEMEKKHRKVGHIGNKWGERWRNDGSMIEKRKIKDDFKEEGTMTSVKQMIRQHSYCWVKRALCLE